jgi:hypothetical protein
MNLHILFQIYFDTDEKRIPSALPSKSCQVFAKGPKVYHRYYGVISKYLITWIDLEIYSVRSNTILSGHSMYETSMIIIILFSKYGKSWNG